ncbi:MAG: DUF3488 and transglutaminase-like domain-containing protein [Candidatus Dormibacteria bacterium]
MATVTGDPEADLKQVEAGALEQLDAEAGHVEADLELAAATADVPVQDLAVPWRMVVASALSVLPASIMAGGIFLGVAPRFYAAVAGLLGVGLAVAASRLKQPALVYILVVVGVFLIGLVLLLPSGFNHLFTLRGDVQAAAASGKILRPPTEFTPGWIAITSWILAAVGFGAGWTAVAIRKPSIAVVLPLPLAAVAGISVSKDTQILSGILAVVLFGAALGTLASAQLGGDEKLPLSYEIRRGVKGLAFLAVVTVALYFGSTSSLLFPHPLYDPTIQPQKPHPVSLSAVTDKVLFEVGDSRLTGPWVLGELDVYDGTDWRLPSFAENGLKNIPSDGVVDRSLKPGEKATFTIRGLTGAVLPTLPNTVGILAKGLGLQYDSRSGNIRLKEGQFHNGYKYTVVSAAPPSVEDVAALGNSPRVPADLVRFEQIPAQPQAVADLIKKAPTTSKWEQFDYLRNWVLQNVVATGVGTPVSIPPSRVQQVITQKEGTPYEIVATQALLARWIGLPSRIGYGFDNGDKVGDHLEVHPANGTAFPEVYFQGFGWIPVIGTPAHAKASQSNNTKKSDPSVLPSNDIAVQIFIPESTPTQPPLIEQLRPLALVLLALLLVVGAIYLAIPVVVKALRRARRRAEAARKGPRAEIVQAYAEWRDHATDFGYGFISDTPLMFVDRFVPDEEHTQLAWLVTRALWGDLGDEITPELATNARELSRALRQRLSQARPITVRFVALVSRLSLKNSYEGPLEMPPTAIERSAA